MPCTAFPYWACRACCRCRPGKRAPKWWIVPSHHVCHPRLLLGGARSKRRARFERSMPGPIQKAVSEATVTVRSCLWGRSGGGLAQACVGSAVRKRCRQKSALKLDSLQASYDSTRLKAHGARPAWDFPFRAKSAYGVALCALGAFPFARSQRPPADEVQHPGQRVQRLLPHLLVLALHHVPGVPRVPHPRPGSRWVVSMLQGGKGTKQCAPCRQDGSRTSIASSTVCDAARVY